MQCVLIGADSLLVECGELLVARGHRIEAVVAGSPKVARWAASKGLRVIDGAPPVERATWEAELAGISFEWLFAITHLALLSDEVVAMASRGAINFHDGPLPRYAGLNAPAWALLNGETTYGISWHEITAGVDEGDVVAQRLFEVAPDETSLSLNTRNFEVALETFAELIDELETGTARRTPQDLSVARTTYLRRDRPPALCVLDWNRSAVDLDRLVRALDFGPYPNPLGSPTLLHGAHAVAVTRVEIRDDEAAPGEIVAIGGEVVVGCAEGSLALQRFATLAGVEVTVDEVVALLGLVDAASLDVFDGRALDELTALGTTLARSEPFFERRLQAIEAIELPWATTPAVDHVARYAAIDVEVPSTFAARFDAALAAATIAAFATVLARLSGKYHFHLALAGHDAGASDAADAAGGALVSPVVPLEFTVPAAAAFDSAVSATTDELDRLRRNVSFLYDVVGRDPELRRRPDVAAGRIAPLGVRLGAGAPCAGVVAELVVDDTRCTFRHDEVLIAAEDAEVFVACLRAVLQAAGDEPSTPLSSIELLDPQWRAQILEGWNRTERDYPRHATLQQLFEAQVDRTPDTVALVFEGSTLTYRDLDRRANQLGAHLRSLGIGPDDLVGVYVERSLELMVAVTGVHKAGAAYVPLDPNYPDDRIEHMIADSGCRVIVTMEALREQLPLRAGSTARVVCLDTDAAAIAAHPDERVPVATEPHHLAYCIYTSGSTGMPKGVLIEHRNVVNFFAGMDEVVAHDLPATWFAVTSLSFDISVLELLYTTTRGFTVVIYLDRAKASSDGDDASFVEQHASLPVDFSLFYFSGDEAESVGAGKYKLLLEGARWADQHDFVAVWTPERHFHAFGGLYPQPAVTGAAVAAITERVQIRAGSVVLPLHHPIRVAEAWSIVDNLSDGRVGISIASGWQPNDFVLMPENHARAKSVMFSDIELVKRLWRGESVMFPGVGGVDVSVQTLPRPVQPELPLWVTTAGNPDTYVEAGRIGANVLTHLLGQSVEQLAPKIQLYRDARREAGFDPDTGVVSLMLHTFVGDDEDVVRDVVREPMKEYLGTSLSLLQEYAWAFPAFQKPGGIDTSLDDDIMASLTDDERDAMLEFAYLRYYETSGLFGTPASCMAMVDRLKGIGVDEIACLVDFGIATDVVLDSLSRLGELRTRANAAVGSTRPSATGALDLSPAAQLRRHGVTHLQCTPSMARMFTMGDDTRDALAAVEHVYVGGEAFPVALAKDLRANSKTGSVTNMYGPTETTIWSTTWKLEGDLDAIPIGKPIANTKIYILDANLQPLPPGVPGDLWIGGDGVVRGYHERPELTADRFVPDPFVPGARMYRTGDIAKWRRLADGSGSIDFLGRVDHQVKLRGYRIELGEIEARLGQHPQVRECVVVLREESDGDQQLVGYVSSTVGSDPSPAELKDHLRVHLPEVMVPAHIAVLDELPHTPNGKIDRNALPSLADVMGQRQRTTEIVVAESDLERTVLGAWRETLATEHIGVDDNFFDIGGHSLLVVRLHRRLRELLERPIALTELYRFPTIRGFAHSLSSDSQSAAMRQSLDRASRRRENLGRRRVRR